MLLIQIMLESGFNYVRKFSSQWAKIVYKQERSCFEEPDVHSAGFSWSLEGLRASLEIHINIFSSVLGKISLGLDAGVLDEPYSAKPAQRSRHNGPPGYIGWTRFQPIYTGGPVRLLR
jgi:hypothetical protein